MEILGIGPSELLLIVVLALIVLGPRDMQNAGRTIGRWLRKVVTSDGWKAFQQTSREIQTLPNRLMREAALEELESTERQLGNSIEPRTGSGLKSSPPRASSVREASPGPDSERPALTAPPSASSAPGDHAKDA